MNTNQVAASTERVVRVQSGQVMLPLFFGLLVVAIALVMMRAGPGASQCPGRAGPPTYQ